jgi:hypothetical protein
LAGEAQVDVAAAVPTANVSIRWLTPRDLTTDDARRSRADVNLTRIV